MTRREVYFYDKKNSKLYVSPEFNGDKSEFVKFSKRMDICDKEWNEIIKEFENIKTLDEFREASKKAQSYYHSFIGDSILPIKEVKEIKHNDEVYMINENGELYLYNPKKLDRNYLINIANKGKFEYQNLIMDVEGFTSKYSNCNIYQLNIERVTNVTTLKTFRLGALEDLKYTSDLDEFIDKEVGGFINKITQMEENMKKEPLKLQIICSPDSNFEIGFQDKNKTKYVLEKEKDGFSLLKLDSSSLEPEYDLNFPIEIEGNILYPVYDGWLDRAVFDKDKIDVQGLIMASELNSYMIIKEDIRNINSNLNDIFHNIYNVENIEKNIFEKYKDDPYTKELKNEYYMFLFKKNVINEMPTQEDEEEEYGPNN